MFQELKENSCIITITNPKCDLVEFYDAVAMEMGFVNTDELHYNCCKINVAQNIQDSFFAYYKEQHPEILEGHIDVNIAVLLMMSGPKVDKNLADNEVEVFDGFIC